MPDSFNHDRSAVDSFAGIPANELSPRIAANLEEIRRKVSSRAFHHLDACLGEFWGDLSDPDRAVNNLERLVLNSAPAVESLLLSHRNAFTDLMVLFATSQYLSDTVIRYAPTAPAVSPAGMPAQRLKVERFQVEWLSVWQRQG